MYDVFCACVQSDLFARERICATPRVEKRRFQGEGINVFAQFFDICRPRCRALK